MTEYRVTRADGSVVNAGDTVVSFRGDSFEFVSVTRGAEYNGTAKVEVIKLDSLGGGLYRSEYYDSVFDLTVETIGKGE